ncbi:hypothetical protein HMPREF0491_02394 [Lachnospiraceae oral taxon 107 str. F0167]|jgi:hypothetical protein|nr:hypothetical protein HMPREF0491_02394 [Lachnospiraceae oral taxon 107 str. F0167]
MGESRKVDIYLPPEIIQMIYNDIELFELFKPDKGDSIMVNNKNAFMNQLLSGYFDNYKNEINAYASDISNILGQYNIKNDTIRDIVSSFFNDIVFSQKEDIYKSKKEIKTSNEKFPFRTTDKNGTIVILDEIESELQNIDTSLSGYICKMLISYFKKPLYEREQIIFSSNYKNILQCCQKNGIKFLYSSDNKWYTVIPYKIFRGKEQMFNYIFCYGLDENQNTKTYSFRLNRITNLKVSNILINIPEDIEKNFLATQRLGASYAINSDLEESCVILNTKGLSSFKHIYFGRPQVDSKEQTPEGNFKYYFKCSTEQLYRYFRRFNSGEAIVEYPIELRNKIISFHQKSLEVYQDGKL